MTNSAALIETRDHLASLADLSRAFSPLPVDALSADELLARQHDVSEVVRRGQAQLAVIAARIAHLSRPELGDEGLARQLGVRTPEALVQNATGTSIREAQAMIRVGTLLAHSSPATPDSADSDSAESDSSDPTFHDPDATPWLHEVASAVAAGRLSLAAADVIRTGLGSPNAAVPAAALADAATTLLHDSASLPLEQLAARARQTRAALDTAQVQATEEEVRGRRYLRMTPNGDGMTRIHGLLDPESAAIVVSAYDAALSPRRGPRFVDPDERERAEELVRDERSNGQLAADTFVELIRIGTAADTGAVLGVRRPSVQVLVTDADLRARKGMAFIEGQTDPVSLNTATRHACSTGYVPIQFDGAGQAINVGRDQRFFTQRQRLALAARDGGCRMFGCDRPPSWCEAHHIDEWQNGGRTDLADGILLCRHHHLWVHNHGWRIVRGVSDVGDPGGYFAVPPASRDPERRPIPLPTKSPAARRLLASVG